MSTLSQAAIPTDTTRIGLLDRLGSRFAPDRDGTRDDQGPALGRVGRGVEIAEIDEQAQGVKYAGFSDPEGNTWTLQEMPWRSQYWS
jgi:hypothetical protein